ncbi:MAG: helix-turn-helix domain-containing protein [Chloroflexota bacterium]|nr:helix-turn-helix domain-containing protein [Chloroflexota bacterium]
MDDLPERYSLETVEQLRGIADPLRIRIFEALAQRPLTATQLGDELQIAAPKAHYHVRELERLGLVTLAESRERGGIVEKYFRAVARNLTVPPQLLQTAEPEEVAAAVNEIFANLSQSFLAALRRELPGGSADENTGLGPGMESATVWMTRDELAKTLKAAMETLEPYRTRRGVPGEREGQVTVITFDARNAEADAPTPSTGSAQPAPQAAQAAPAVASASGREPRLRKVTLIGALTYNRADLERVLAANEQLELDVAGYLSFNDDVPPELIDRAIARLRYRGMLNASSGVMAALKRKEPHAR